MSLINRLYPGVASLLFASALAAAEPKVLKQEPPPGGLKFGEIVLVDDGSCPKGQIKEVTGAQNLRALDSTVPDRKRRCIPRPSNTK